MGLQTSSRSDDCEGIMARVILSKEQQTELPQDDDMVEICDHEGRHLGWFIRNYAPMDDCPYTEEELARRKTEKGGRPLADIWRDLEAQAS
jgi:hypothetical protein